MARTYEEVQEYVEWQCQNKCKVLSAKTEQSFDDLGVKVNVWNVKTDTEGDWWVVEGEQIPMNLYPQSAYYFSADEVYSFHIGITERMKSTNSGYEPSEYIKAVSGGTEITPLIFRKLNSIASLIDTAKEVEDFQAIGVQCREILIELGNAIYESEMSGEGEQPQASNFKKKAELFIQFHLCGSQNAEYRSMIKKITEATWDYACKLTHSRTTSYYEASTCVSLIISLVSTYFNVQSKANDILAEHECCNCRSKQLKITHYKCNDSDEVTDLLVKCDECGEITELHLSE